MEKVKDAKGKGYSVKYLTTRKNKDPWGAICFIQQGPLIFIGGHRKKFGSKETRAEIEIRALSRAVLARKDYLENSEKAAEDTLCLTINLNLKSIENNLQDVFDAARIEMVDIGEEGKKRIAPLLFFNKREEKKL